MPVSCSFILLEYFLRVTKTCTRSELGLWANAFLRRSNLYEVHFPAHVLCSTGQVSSWDQEYTQWDFLRWNGSLVIVQNAFMELGNGKDKDRLPSSGYIVKLLHLHLTHFVIWMAKLNKINSTIKCWSATWKHSNHLCIQPDSKKPCCAFFWYLKAALLVPKTKKTGQRVSYWPGVLIPYWPLGCKQTNAH